MIPFKPLMKLLGDGALLTALALSPVAMAQNDPPPADGNRADRDARIEGARERRGDVIERRREFFSENEEQRRERLMARRDEQAGDNGVNPRRRGLEEGAPPTSGQTERRRWNAAPPPGTGEFARRRWNNANPPGPEDFARRRWNNANPSPPPRPGRPAPPTNGRR